MRLTQRIAHLVLCLAVLAAPAAAPARDHIEVAGSSTIFPFTARVIQSVAKAGVTVVNKSTGSGGGIRAFCSGPGDDWPDITAASRAMTDAERERCRANSVDGVTQLAIGYDGIVLANSVNAPQVNFTRGQLFLGLAGQVPMNGALVPNPHFSWNEIDPALPAKKIELLGPPGTSGTREMFIALAIKHGCASEISSAGIQVGGGEASCTALRQDGHYTELGEDDVEIVKQLGLFENAFGIFGYSYLLRYHDRVQANAIDGVLPTDETIESGAYPLSRPLYLYVKSRRIQATPGMGAFLTEYLSDKAIGDEGYLLDIGLVPLSEEQRSATQKSFQELLNP